MFKDSLFRYNFFYVKLLNWSIKQVSDIELNIQENRKYMVRHRILIHQVSLPSALTHGMLRYHVTRSFSSYSLMQLVLSLISSAFLQFACNALPLWLVFKISNECAQQIIIIFLTFITNNDIFGKWTLFDFMKVAITHFSCILDNTLSKISYKV